MPLALGNGFIDTGLRENFTATGNVSIKVYNNPAWNSPTLAAAVFGTGAANSWTVRGTGDAVRNIGCPAGSQSQGNRSFILEGPFVGSPFTLATYAWGPCGLDTGPAGIAAWAPEWAYSESAGPYRLGYRLTVIDALAPKPWFWTNYRIELAWFGDGFTKFVQSMAGKSATRWMNASGGWSATQNATLPPVDLGDTAHDFTWQAATVAPIEGDDQVRVTNLSFQGVLLDLAGIDDPTVRIDGAGAMTILGVPSPSGGGLWAVAPSFTITEQCSVMDFAGTDMAANTYDADNNLRATPWTANRVKRQVSWVTDPPFTARRLFSIQSAWATSRPVPLPVTDLQIPVRQSPPRLLGTATQYTPVSLSLSPEVEVHRPGGVIPSAWVPSDARITVTETMAETVIEVSAEGATVTREFVGTQNWRNRVGLGAGGTGHADFGIEEYEVYRHNYSGWSATGEDAWAWGTYAWLAYRLQAPETHDLSLAVNGSHLAIVDPHVTGAAREAGYSATEHPYSVAYAVPVSLELQERHLDLLFPATPVPFYHARVQSLTLSGFRVGTYRIKRLALAATGQAYLKCYWGLQVQRSDYSALVAAVNGAFVLGNWPDTSLKPDETGDYGGGVRYITESTGSGSGTVLDEQKSLSDFIRLLNKIEGWSVVYSDAVQDAAMNDPLSALSPQLAQFLEPLVPYVRLSPGETLQPVCSVIGAQLDIVSGYPFAVHARLHLWGALEAQGVTDGRRAESGALVKAVRVDTGATLATGLTDEDGFVIVAPVPANGALEVTLQDGAT